ncbi:MAG: TRAP transporter small permease subunit [Burkholderiales bacterium]|nr:TRAP transporter small permease subunit [Burkholderiales bacterium]
MLALLLKRVEALGVWLAGLGAAIIVVQMLWISYGVFMRYVVGRPDGTVTEATALLLFPAAFLGLAYALKEDAYPKVMFLPDALGPRGRRRLELLNLLLMLAVGGFFAIAAVDATRNSFVSGAASEILLWPRWLFWAPGAVALVLFTLYVVLRLAVLLTTPASSPARRG